MSTTTMFIIGILTVIGAIVFERAQRNIFCQRALKKSGFLDITNLAGNAARGTKRIGTTTFAATATPTEDASAAHIEIVFASTPASPSLSARSARGWLSDDSLATLGWGEERWNTPMNDALRCLGSPAPSRFRQCEGAFFFDIKEIVTTDFDTTVRVSAYTSHSNEFARRFHDMNFRDRINVPQNIDAQRHYLVSSALDAALELAHAIDGATRRHASSDHATFWRRAWRGTNAATPRGEAFTILGRFIGEDAMWNEARIFGDAIDLAFLWRRDPDRALAEFATRERAIILGAPRRNEPALHDAVRETLDPDWIDKLDWAEVRPILALMRQTFGTQNLTGHLSRLARRVSAGDRAELISALGPDADALMTRGGLSLSVDDTSRGGLTSASDQGGLTEVE